MTYNSIKGRFTRVAPDKSIVYGDKPYTFALTPEQSEQIDQAVYAVVLAKNYKTTSFSIDEKLTLSDEEVAQHKLVVRLLRLRKKHKQPSHKPLTD